MGWQWHQLDNMQIIYTSFHTHNHTTVPHHSVLRGRIIAINQWTVGRVRSRRKRQMINWPFHCRLDDVYCALCLSFSLFVSEDPEAGTASHTDLAHLRNSWVPESINHQSINQSTNQSIHPTIHRTMKLPSVPQTNEMIWAASGPNFTILWGHVEELSLIHIWRCRRSTLCRSRWSPYH